MNRTAGRALGDLEPDETRGLEEHLASCASCRSSAEIDRRTVDALRADSVETSEGRRERVVAAMVAARREMGTTVMPRRRWIAASVAAALLLALSVPFLMSRGGLSVRRLDGAAWIQRAGAQEYVALQIGDRLGAGDWLKTESVVGLEGPGGFRIIVNRNSRIAYEAERRSVRLAEGAIFVESPAQELTVVDPLDRRATVRDGSAEVRLPIVASGSGEKKSEFVVHVDKGVVHVTGVKESREAKSGEQWSVDGQGKLRDEKPGVLAPWRKQP